MKEILCLAAKGVIRDARTNSISVFNIIEEVTPQGFPVLFQEIAFLGVWMNDAPFGSVPTSVNFNLILNGRKISSQEMTVRIESGRIHRHIIAVQGLVVTEPGELRAEFESNGDVFSSYSVYIRNAAPELFDDAVPPPARARGGGDE